METSFPARNWWRAAALAIAVFASACAAQETGPSSNVLTNGDILTLADAGFGEAFMIEMIGASRAEFDTSADAMADLKKHGVKEQIIRAMRSAGATEKKPTKPAFADTGLSQHIRVFLDLSPDPSPDAQSTARTAEIAESFAANCPALLITGRKESATFLMVLDRSPAKLLRPATTSMVVFDRAGDTIYGSERELDKAVRGFCALAQSAMAKSDESFSLAR